MYSSITFGLIVLNLVLMFAVTGLSIFGESKGLPTKHLIGHIAAIAVLGYLYLELSSRGM